MSLTDLHHWVLTSVIFQICDSFCTIIFILLSMFMGCLYIYVSAMTYMSNRNIFGVSACGTYAQCRHINIATHKHQKVNINVLLWLAGSASHLDISREMAILTHQMRQVDSSVSKVTLPDVLSQRRWVVTDSTKCLQIIIHLIICSYSPQYMWSPKHCT